MEDQAQHEHRAADAEMDPANATAAAVSAAIRDVGARYPVSSAL